MPLGSPPLGRIFRVDPEQPDDRQPDLTLGLPVEPHDGLVPVTGEIAHLTGSHGRLYPFSDGEVFEESLPEGGDVGEGERPTEVSALVTTIGHENARDAVEVRPADLRDEARPDRLPYELSLELRILLSAPL